MGGMLKKIKEGFLKEKNILHAEGTLFEIRDLLKEILKELKNARKNK